MAPEHLRALVGRTPALIRQVDRRSDIYSLGMVLAEMLTGHRPFDQSGSYSALPLQIEAMAVERSKSVPSLRQERPDLSWGLESIVRKCLAPDPAAAVPAGRPPGRRPAPAAGGPPAQARPRAEPRGASAEVRPPAPAADLVGHGRRGAPRWSCWRSARRWRRPAPSWPTPGRATRSAPTTRACCGRSAWSTRASICRTTCARASRPASGRSPSSARPRIRTWDAAPGLAPAGPGGSPAAGRGPARAAPAPGRRPRPPGRGIERLGRAGPASCSTGRGDPRPAPFPRALARPGALLLVAGRDRSGPHSARRRAEQTPATTARDHYLLASSLARQGGPEGLEAAIAELDEALRLQSPPLLVAGPAGDLPPGAGRARRGRGRLRPVHGHLAGIRLGLFQSRLRARPGRQQGRGRSSTTPPPWSATPAWCRPTSTAGWPGWS